MSKRNNITYVKPQEPSFLAKLKAEIGYKEGPTLADKRPRLERNGEGDSEGSQDSGDDERPEREEEQPQVVVLKAGDLTAEEAREEKRLAAKELAEKRADLSEPIVFKKKVKQVDIESGSSKTKSEKSKSKSKKSKPIASSSKLSFNEDEEDEAQED